MKDSGKKEFNQIEYNRKYNDTHYKRLNLNMLPVKYDMIQNYCTDMGISKSAFVVSACEYIINNDISLEEFYRDGKK